MSILKTATLALTLITSHSAFAGTATYFDLDGSADWQISGKTAPADHPEFMSLNESFNVSIKYRIENTWIVNSASFWVKGVDDYNNNDHCTGYYNCSDSGSFSDTAEQATVTKMEGISGAYGSTEINAYGWYKINQNVAPFLVNSGDSSLEITLKAANGDFWFKNAKLEIDYSVKAVPVPGSVWLLGSALAAFVGYRQRARKA